MRQSSMVTVLITPLVTWRAARLFAQEYDSGATAIVGSEASVESGRTIVRVETTTPSVSYISYSRDATTYVVDMYGLAIGDVPTGLDVSSAEVHSVRLEVLVVSTRLTNGIE